ncbi:DUF6862 domain-containing protein, partial [Ralstonia syzygii]
NREASNALVAQLKANLGLNYTSGTVKDDIHQNFIKEDGPLPGWVGAVVAVAISIVTAGAGAGLMAIMMAGMLSSVASQALTTGKVNLGQALEAGAISVVTAGLTQGALSALNLSSVGASTIGNNIATGSWAAAQSNLGSYFAASVVRSAISAGVSTVAYGGSFGQAFANGMVQSAAALGANAIGTLSPGIGEVNASTNSIVGNILGHVALGCAISSMQGTGCAGGAAGGFAGSVVAPLVGSGLYSGASGENRAIDAATVAIAGLAGGAIAQAIGGDATAGASTGQNAATNNWLEHRAPFKGAYSEQERRDRAAAACKDDPKQCDVANDWDAKSGQRDADLQAACANPSSDACRGAIAVAKAAGNNIVFAGGKVYAFGPNEPAARSLEPSPAAKTLDTMVGSPLAGIFGGIPYFKSNADPAAGYYFAQYGMALEGIGAGVLGLPTGPLAGPGWRATLESPNTLYVGSGAGSALPTWTNVAGPYSVIGQGGGAATTVRAGPGYSAADVVPVTNTAAIDSATGGAQILPGMSRPLRAPNSDFPPNQGVVDAMNSQTVRSMVANTSCVDCSDIATYLFNSAGEKGQVLEVIPATRNNLNVYENGQIAPGQTYHQVYSDGRYVYDPRVASTPIPQGDWLQFMKGTNPAGISISVVKGGK